VDVSLLPLVGIIVLCGLAFWRLAFRKDRFYDMDEAWTIATSNLRSRQDDR